MLADEEKTLLLKIARKAISQALKQEGKFGLDFPVPKSKILNEPGAAFVTLNLHGELRGCIGSLEAREPLWKCVAANAVNAAFNDFRFSPVSSQQELGEIEIEISVLTPPKRVSSKNEGELLMLLVPMKHGVTLQWQNGAGSTFLPQVWEELPGKREFLSHLSMKAGMPPDAWKSAQVSTYEAIVFSEKEFGLG